MMFRNCITLSLLLTATVAESARSPIKRYVKNESGRQIDIVFYQGNNREDMFSFAGQVSFSGSKDLMSETSNHLNFIGLDDDKPNGKLISVPKKYRDRNTTMIIDGNFNIRFTN